MANTIVDTATATKQLQDTSAAWVAWQAFMVVALQINLQHNSPNQTVPSRQTLAWRLTRRTWSKAPDTHTTPHTHTHTNMHTESCAPAQPCVAAVSSDSKNVNYEPPAASSRCNSVHHTAVMRRSAFVGVCDRATWRTETMRNAIKLISSNNNNCWRIYAYVQHSTDALWHNAFVGAERKNRNIFIFRFIWLTLQR